MNNISSVQFSSVQSLSHVLLFATLETAECQTSLSITNSQSLFKFMSIKLVMPSNHLILYHPLLLLPSIYPSIRVFSNESALCIRWPKYWSFTFSISPSNEYLGLFSFRMDWLDLLAVQEDEQHAAAKSLQSCLTLCDPIDGSPPGSAVPGILQARTLEWVAISFSTEHHRKAQIMWGKEEQLSGLPRWLNGKESTCQCRSHGF